VLRLGVLIIINLGIMNILPIPPLDGGRMLFMVVEDIRGKAIPPEKEGMIHFAGIILLFGLMILLTFMDVKNLLG
ncbi:MAG: site-2 protease family protein, partial [Clostridia bacterium]|nr:site-2 protease family protein [Clostridia bacterium]